MKTINTRQAVAMHSSTVRNGRNIVRGSEVVRMLSETMRKAAFDSMSVDSIDLVNGAMCMRSDKGRWGPYRCYTVIRLYVHLTTSESYMSHLTLSYSQSTMEYLGRSDGWYVSSESDLCPIAWGEDLPSWFYDDTLEEIVRSPAKLSRTSRWRNSLQGVL